MAKKSAGYTNLQLRIISAFIIGVLFISALFLFRPLFFLLMLAIAGMMLVEWYNITKSSPSYLATGLIIIPIPVSSLLKISTIDYSGWLLFSFFSIMWVVDSFAMFVGKKLQGPRLAPKLSPNKTISGLVGGVTAAAMLPLVFRALPFSGMEFYEKLPVWQWMLVFAIIGFIAQMSDLFISFFKRKFKVKDSGSIIPGHGGFLDRFDSIILTAPVVMICLKLIF